MGGFFPGDGVFCKGIIFGDIRVWLWCGLGFLDGRRGRVGGVQGWGMLKVGDVECEGF